MTRAAPQFGSISGRIIQQPAPTTGETCSGRDTSPLSQKTSARNEAFGCPHGKRRKKPQGAPWISISAEIDTRGFVAGKTRARQGDSGAANARKRV